MTLIRTAASVTRLSGVLGAVVHDIPLGGDLSASEVNKVRDALLEHRVVFFRDQHHLDDEGQRRFAQLLGPITAANPLSTSIGGGADHTVAIDSHHIQANAWHTDATFVDRPPAFSVLRAIKLPSVGGDTLWANTVAAYQRMGPVLQGIVDHLWARHSNAFDYAARELPEDGGLYQSKDYADVANVVPFEVDHPVVRIHPETEERAILLGYLATQLVGLKRADSDDLIALIQRHVERPDNLVRWSWRPGDVAIWDNRSTQHYAISDYDEHRLLRRVTVAGDVPVGVDGRSSRVVSGDASSFSPIHVPPSRAKAVLEETA